MLALPPSMMLFTEMREFTSSHYLLISRHGSSEGFTNKMKRLSV